MTPCGLGHGLAEQCDVCTQIRIDRVVGAQVRGANPGPIPFPSRGTYTADKSEEEDDGRL